MEPKNMADIGVVIGTKHLGFGDDTTNLFTSLFGVGMFVSGPINAWSVRTFGEARHTTLTQLLSALAFAVRGFVLDGRAAFATIPLFFWAGCRGTVTKIDASRIAKRVGMSSGEFNGLVANLRAAMTAVSPSGYSALYQSGVKARQPGRP